jgi:hypothetical protein
VTKFRKKPVEIEAMQVPAGRDDDDLIAWGRLGAWLGPGGPWQLDGSGNVAIHTLEGTMLARPGDWVIRGVAGELYPCRPDIFAQTYEPV